jgi:hypothetical protein
MTYTAQTKAEAARVARLVKSLGVGASVAVQVAPRARKPVAARVPSARVTVWRERIPENEPIVADRAAWIARLRALLELPDVAYPDGAWREIGATSVHASVKAMLALLEVAE